MRSLVVVVLFVLAGLSYFVLAGAPATPVDPRVDVGVDEGLQQADVLRAGLAHVPAPSRRESVRTPVRADPGSVADAAAPSLTARILVTVEPKGTLSTPPPLAGLRVRATSVQTNQCFNGSTVSAAGLSEIRVGGGDRYRVEVDPASVPEGYAASGKFRLGFLDESGVAGAFTEVEDGQAVPVTLSIFRTSQLSGIVTGPDGLPLDGVTVRAQGLAPGMAGLAHDAVTGAFGDFELPGLLPFVYGVNVVDAGAHAGLLERVPQPARQLFDLQHGPFEGVHLSLGSGPITLVGSVVDEAGSPFEHVSVRAYYVGDEAHGVALNFPRAYDWSDQAFLTRTNAEGEFRVTGLGVVPLRIQVGASEASNGPGRRVKFVPEPVEVNLGPGSSRFVDVGRIELARSRRFVVQGCVALAAADYPDLRLKHSRIQLSVPAYERGPHAVKRPGTEVRPFLDYDKSTGVFTLSCDTPLDDCPLTVALRGHSNLDKEYRFHPAPNVTLTDQVLSFP